ncbi:MAG: DUF3300 domain-containing protein [Deltaproteobacteria bacterium]|nr:DUF3300 domain-containing protein [Deltaproteobacteria bacterium]
MRKTLALALVFCVALLGLVANSRIPPVTATAQAQEYFSDEWLSPKQLDNLLAPIALYPDPLLAQVLVAATFVDQVDEAARWMRVYNDPGAIDNQPWDVSVKAVAHYPSVLYMMNDRIDWTIALGQAYVNQSTDVMASVQRLRAMAYSAGNLASTPQQEVIVEREYIYIVPFQPRVIYVPAYDPSIVYVRRSFYFDPYPATVITFGPAFPIGAWLNRDCDWGRRRIYYHGWQGRGWIARSRPVIHVTNVYVHNNHTNIQINRNIVRRRVNYAKLNGYASVHRDVNYNHPGRGNRGGPGEPNAGSKIIRRDAGISGPWSDTRRGRPPFEQQAGREEKLPPTREKKSPQAPEKKSSPAKMRPQLTPPSPPADTARPAPQPPPRDRRPIHITSAGNRISDPRATSEAGQVRRAPVHQPAPSPPAKALKQQGERSERWERRALQKQS